jgi:hypothetical protein
MLKLYDFMQMFGLHEITQLLNLLGFYVNFGLYLSVDFEDV